MPPSRRGKLRRTVPTAEEVLGLALALETTIGQLLSPSDQDDLLEGGRGVLVLGKSPGVDADADVLVQAITAGSRPLAVVLSACETGTAGGPAGAAPLAAELVTKGKISIVSAMAGEVSEQACRLYTRRFVMAVGDGESVVEASAKGRAALLNAENRSDHLDWAMPTLFLASSLKPDFRPINPGPGRELMKIAGGLRLRQDPVFIGRQEIFRIIDDELIPPDPAKGIGFVAIMSEDIAGLGGTRLLKEIGFRLLRRGHLPLLLGPYGEKGAPKSLREVVSQILDQALTAREQLKLRPASFEVFGADREFESPAGTGIFDLPDAVFRFKQGTQLEPALVRGRLAYDLTALARQASEAGEPFGPHTRVVVLADEFHHWVGGLDGVLAILKKNLDSGLGTAECPVPLVVTGSSRIAGGATLKAFIDEHAGMGLRAPPLRALALADAILGFEWVLLHPWQKDVPERQVVYTRARTAIAAQIQLDFDQLGGIPTKVKSDLYLLARTLANHGHFVVGNDEEAWQAYVNEYG